MRDRFNQADVWERSGLPVAELNKIAYDSPWMRSFRARLFTRIVPTLKDIGLLGPAVEKALADMGVMEYAQLDARKMLENDARVADEFDQRAAVRRRHKIAL
jgi:predicted flap endonuclease-1-like 5' DNA nuclease